MIRVNVHVSLTGSSAQREHRTDQTSGEIRAQDEACREIARSHGRSFYLASQLLSSEQRSAIHAVYAFCRIADDIVDHADASDPASAERELDAWKHQLVVPRNPVAIAFERARDQYGIPLEPALELIDGVRGDLRPRRYQTWSELAGYCHAVAGTIGLLTAPVLGCRDDAALRHADALGMAMQLTNIVRDVAEDAEAGRLYLPIDEIEAFGCDPESILAGTPAGDFPGLIRLQIGRARELYRIGLQGVPALDGNGRLATLAAARFYAGILTELERANCDPFRGRARVSTPRKLMHVPGLLVDFAQTFRNPWSGYGSPA